MLLPYSQPSSQLKVLLSRGPLTECHWLFRSFTDQTVKVCAYNFSESAFLQAKQAIIELTLRTI